MSARSALALFSDQPHSKSYASLGRPSVATAVCSAAPKPVPSFIVAQCALQHRQSPSAVVVLQVVVVAPLVVESRLRSKGPLGLKGGSDSALCGPCRARKTGRVRARSPCLVTEAGRIRLVSSAERLPPSCPGFSEQSSRNSSSFTEPRGPPVCSAAPLEEEALEGSGRALPPECPEAPLPSARMVAIVDLHGGPELRAGKQA